jgi:hypothetical protein
MLLAALWPWDRLILEQKWVAGIFLGVKSSPARRGDLTAIFEPIVCKMWEPRRHATLWVSTASYMDNFIFFFFYHEKHSHSLIFQRWWLNYLIWKHVFFSRNSDTYIPRKHAASKCKYDVTERFVPESNYFLIVTACIVIERSRRDGRRIKQDSVTT